MTKQKKEKIPADLRRGDEDRFGREAANLPRQKRKLVMVRNCEKCKNCELRMKGEIGLVKRDGLHSVGEEEATVERFASMAPTRTMPLIPLFTTSLPPRPSTLWTWLIAGG